MFYLTGTDGAERIGSITATQMANKASQLINTTDKHVFMPIVYIKPIKLNESKHVTLVAFTQYGIRFYFSLNTFNSNDTTTQSQSQQPPQHIQLVHVRIPPQLDACGTGQISSGYYNDGITLMFAKRDEISDGMLLLNRDLFQLHSQYKESKQFVDVPGRFILFI